MNAGILGSQTENAGTVGMRHTRTKIAAQENSKEIAYNAAEIADTIEWNQNIARKAVTVNIRMIAAA